MKKFDKTGLSYAPNADLKVVLEDMLDHLNQYDGDLENAGVEYTIGKIFGGELKLVFNPGASIYDVIEIDGVDGFGYCSVVQGLPESPEITE